MDFRDTAEEADFRARAVEWLEASLAELPEGLDPRTQQARERNGHWWQAKLAEGGWAGLTWPPEYGGQGRSVVYEAIFNEEAARRGAPAPVNLLGMILAGPTILVHGTEAQKQRFLAPMLSGEEIWCQGFSEPGAGSDLAGLRSRATATDGGYVVNGQKVWTSYAHAADRCMLLARTGELDGADGKHAGLTYFLAPMEEVEVRPLVMINGDSDFNEMFCNDVFVAEDEVLGTVGDGWKVALTTLAFERAALAFVLTARARRAFEGLRARVSAVGAADDPAVTAELGRLYADVEGLRVATVRQLSAVSAGHTPGAEGSAVKLVWARTMQAITRLAVELGGPDGVAFDDAADARWLSGYLRARGNSVEGGTDEVQRSIIAERVLGLPRSR